MDYKASKELAIDGIDVYIAAMSRAMNTYLINPDVPAGHINDSLRRLSVFEQQIFDLEKYKDEVPVGRPNKWSSLHTIPHFLGNDYLYIAGQEELEAIAQRERCVERATFYSTDSINAGISAAMYKSLSSLARLQSNWYTYQAVVELLNGIVMHPSLKEGYREPFEARLWQQIKLNTVRRWYPVPVKAYLEFMGLIMLSDAHQNEWVKNQVERLRRLLYVDWQPMFESAEKMMDGRLMRDALLPGVLRYTDGQFIYTTGFGDGKEEVVPRPSEGASAMAGVDITQLPDLM